MAHLTYDELEKLLRNTSVQVEVGGVYAHYKTPTSRYKVLGLTVLEADNRIAVRYSSEEHPTVEFIRPLDSWLALVDGVKRFEKVG